MSADSPSGGAVSIGDAAAQQPPPAPDPQPTASFETPTATEPPSGSGSDASSLNDKLPDGVAQLTEKPEAMVGAAFAGGLLFAIVLKRLGR